MQKLTQVMLDEMVMGYVGGGQLGVGQKGLAVVDRLIQSARVKLGKTKPGEKKEV